MNERIQELAEQATRTAMWPGDPDAGDLDAEKFAQLIVAECAELCSDLDGGENMFSRGIRRHFGVEE